MYRYTEKQLITSLNKYCNNEVIAQIINDLHYERKLKQKDKLLKMMNGVKNSEYNRFLLEYPINYKTLYYPNAYQETIIHENANILAMLDKLRYQHHWDTLHDMGDELGLSRNHLYNWYHGLTHPKLNTLLKLTKLTNIPISEWLNLPSSNYEVNCSNFEPDNLIHHLKDYRDKYGISNNTLSKRIGISRNTLINILYKHQQPSLKLMILISETCEVPIDELCYSIKKDTNQVS